MITERITNIGFDEKRDLVTKGKKADKIWSSTERSNGERSCVKRFYLGSND